jgi:hemerythrin-like metal-binding protein
MNQFHPRLLTSPAAAAAMMTEAHARMRAAATALSGADDAVFPARLQAFVAEVENDFHAEEAVMEAIDYAGLPAHREEHARLLSALHHIDAMVDGGNLTAGREALALLPHWCCMHELGMDQALLHALGSGVIRSSSPEEQRA